MALCRVAAAVGPLYETAETRDHGRHAARLVSPDGSGLPRHLCAGSSGVRARARFYQCRFSPCRASDSQGRISFGQSAERPFQIDGGSKVAPGPYGLAVWAAICGGVSYFGIRVGDGLRARSGAWPQGRSGICRRRGDESAPIGAAGCRQGRVSELGDLFVGSLGSSDIGESLFDRNTISGADRSVRIFFSRTMAVL